MRHQSVALWCDGSWGFALAAKIIEKACARHHEHHICATEWLSMLRYHSVMQRAYSVLYRRSSAHAGATLISNSVRNELSVF